MLRVCRVYVGFKGCTMPIFKEEMTMEKTLNYRVDNSKVFEYIVEYLHVTAKTHSFKGYRVYAGSKEEAIRKCPKRIITGRVLKVGYETISGLREVVNADYLKSDRGCRVF